MHSNEIIIRRDVKFNENLLACKPTSMFVSSSSCDPSSKFVLYFFSIQVSSSSDDVSEDENPPLPSHLPPNESIEHEPTPSSPLLKWVHSTREVVGGPYYHRWTCSQFQ
jgi:hypothetical protein